LLGFSRVTLPSITTPGPNLTGPFTVSATACRGGCGDRQLSGTAAQVCYGL
jgi:hypothetical protein